jgi:hypothetical protein
MLERAAKGLFTPKHDFWLQNQMLFCNKIRIASHFQSKKNKNAVVSRVARWLRYLHTQNTNFGLFWKALERKFFLVFLFKFVQNISLSLRIFLPFWYIFTILVFYTLKNLATLVVRPMYHI